jgi:lipopolysaccharide transport system ATP-binding protein
MAASLYGLSKEEIDQRFDAIASFADIGDHIYHPVKSYSSGMYVRLAFAVIAHVDADILVVDEALAVGDAVFTEKCMRFIRKFKENGTLLFVSHDMGSVLNLCERAVWLHLGEARMAGAAKEISEAYFKYTQQEMYGNQVQLKVIQQEEVAVSEVNEIGQNCEIQALDYQADLTVHNNLNEANGWKTGAGEIISVALTMLDSDPRASDVLKGGELVKMTIVAQVNEDMSSPIIGFLVRDRLGQDLFGENTLPFTDSKPFQIQAGDKVTAEFIFCLPMLPNGSYSVMTSFAEGDLHKHIQHHWLHNSLLINVQSSKVRWGLVGINFKEINFFK